MTHIRLRPAGFDARPERPSSLRAQAQRMYRAQAGRDESLKDTPLPNPPPQGGREQAVLGEGELNYRGVRDGRLTSLTQQVRALYEDSAVPVAEIARLAGVAQRTLYRYVEKGGWRRRRAAQDIASAVAKRASVRKPRPCVTAKGEGGRFIRSGDVGKPIRRGMKALDPQGEARALVKCSRAAALSKEAVRRTRAAREAISDARTMALLVGVLRDIAAIEAMGEAAAAVPEKDSDQPSPQELARRVELLRRDREARQAARALSQR